MILDELVGMSSCRFLHTVQSLNVSSMGGGSLVAQLVKNLPAMRETRVQSLGWEDPPEKEMAIPSIILAWEIPWTEEPVHGAIYLELAQHCNSTIMQ